MWFCWWSFLRNQRFGGLFVALYLLVLMFLLVGILIEVSALFGRCIRIFSAFFPSLEAYGPPSSACTICVALIGVSNRCAQEVCFYGF